MSSIIPWMFCTQHYQTNNIKHTDEKIETPKTQFGDKHHKNGLMVLFVKELMLTVLKSLMKFYIRRTTFKS
jgi:hypothetical protein